MPYRKSYRRYRKKRTYPKSNYQLARKVNYLSSMVNSELKFHNTTVSASALSATGTVYSLSDIPQGDAATAREGNSVLPRYLSLNGYIYSNSTTAEIVRVILFRYWGESTDATPSVAPGDVLQTATVLSFLNQNNIGSKGDRERRIEVLKSKMYNLNIISSVSVNVKWNVQSNGPNTRYKTHMKYRTSATQQPVSGGYYLLVISDSTTAGSTIDFQSKLSYHDN